MSKPWYNVVQPREDLRKGKPLDAAEFAVNLGQVLTQQASAVYQQPEQFFARTYLTKNLTDLAAEVTRRLAGEVTETSAVFNLITQFGGGKTHALTLLYHLAKQGKVAKQWEGVNKVLLQAEVSEIPKAAVAVFVGTDFDALTGRGGTDGTLLRKTPWGEIAFQLGGPEVFQAVAEHDKQGIAPAGDVIKQMLPAHQPCLILMDELMNYASRNGSQAFTQLYNFLQVLSEEIRGRTQAVLVVSLPASELEMSAEDQANYGRLEKLLNRLGKAMVMATENETTEIIRRRLFEWENTEGSREGKMSFLKEAKLTGKEYAQWVTDNHTQLANFPINRAAEEFLATYPFHPSVLSVFERKWQTLPKFQQTRGVLRLLALWVAHACQQGMRGEHKDKLITLGTAPLEDSIFRSAVFDQLGDQLLEPVVNSDINGKAEAFAVRLDENAEEILRKVALHRKIATVIFFESSGGMLRKEATLPEIRLAVGEPGLEIGHIESALEALTSACYYLSVERNRYRFSSQPNLNKLHADRCATVKPADIQARLRTEVQKLFTSGSSLECKFFPRQSDDIPNRPVITLVILSPEQVWQDNVTKRDIDKMIKECGSTSRVFKNALFWVVADSSLNLLDEARKLLAWEMIEEEKKELRLEEKSRTELANNLKKHQGFLKDNIWRAYKNVVFLGENNQLQLHDLGPAQPSANPNMVKRILEELLSLDLVTKSLQPRFFTRNWSPAYEAWDTKAVKEMFFASPKYPRLLNADQVLKEVIAKGVKERVLAYVGKTTEAGYQPFYFGESLTAEDIEISEEMWILQGEKAEIYLKTRIQQTAGPVAKVTHTHHSDHTVHPTAEEVKGLPAILSPRPIIQSKNSFVWQGELHPNKWMIFYRKVLTKQVADADREIKLTVTLEVTSKAGFSGPAEEEIQVALREVVQS